MLRRNCSRGISAYGDQRCRLAGEVERYINDNMILYALQPEATLTRRRTVRP